MLMQISGQSHASHLPQLSDGVDEFEPWFHLAVDDFEFGVAKSEVVFEGVAPVAIVGRVFVSDLFVGGTEDIVFVAFSQSSSWASSLSGSSRIAR